MIEPLEQFRFINGLTKKDIAEYLQVSRPFVSSVCNGKCPLPDKHRLSLLNNDRGWDATMLEVKQSEQKETIAVKELINQLEVKDRRINELITIINNLTQ